LPRRDERVGEGSGHGLREKLRVLPAVTLDEVEHVAGELERGLEAPREGLRDVRLDDGAAAVGALTVERYLGRQALRLDDERAVFSRKPFHQQLQLVVFREVVREDSPRLATLEL